MDDLLEVSRITLGKIRLTKEPLDASVIARNAVEISRSLIERKKQTLDVSLPDRPIWLDADLTRMVQALGNLLNNAAKYTPEGGRISLALERDGAGAVFRVRDNGIGIEPQVCRRSSSSSPRRRGRSIARRGVSGSD